MPYICRLKSSFSIVPLSVTLNDCIGNITVSTYSFASIYVAKSSFVHFKVKVPLCPIIYHNDKFIILSSNFLIVLRKYEMHPYLHDRVTHSPYLLDLVYDSPLIFFQVYYPLFVPCFPFPFHLLP